MIGFGIVNKTSELLPIVFTVTSTGPVEALAGTVAMIWLSLRSLRCREFRQSLPC